MVRLDVVSWGRGNREYLTTYYALRRVDPRSSNAITRTASKDCMDSIVREQDCRSASD
jgi:hypothetical protein